MNFMKRNWSGILVCLVIAIPSWILGKIFPVIGGAVIAIIAGMIVTMFWNDKGKAEAGIKWTSKMSCCPARIWNESWRNLSDRKAVITDYCMYGYNISCYCLDTASIT